VDTSVTTPVLIPANGGQANAEEIGFRFGAKGTHSSRTMMLDELRLVLSATPATAKRADYTAAIVEENCLSKPTNSTRRLTEKHYAHLAPSYVADTIRARFPTLGIADADDAGIDRILDNVGCVPCTLDKSELRKDILAAWDFYQGYKRDASKGAKTERRKHATKIAHKTRELIHLLNDPAASRIGRLLSLRERNEDEKASLTRSLGTLLSVVGTNERQCTGTASFREVLNVRPSFWLIGNDLVNVFEKHFAKQAARTRNSDGQPDGPFCPIRNRCDSRARRACRG